MSHSRERFTKFRVVGGRPVWSQVKAAARSCDRAFGGSHKFSWRSTGPSLQCARIPTLLLPENKEVGVASEHLATRKPPRFDPTNLFVHLASASAQAAIADAEALWSAARNVERSAAHQLKVCTQQCRAAETRSVDAANSMAGTLEEQEHRKAVLHTKHTSLQEEEDQAALCEDGLMRARQVCEEASEVLREAEAKLTKSKLKARKKQKSKKKKKKLQRAVAEAESALKLAMLELGNAESALAGAEEAVRVQTETVARAHRHANLAREKLEKATAERAAAETALASARDHGSKMESARVAAAAVLQQAEGVSAERKARTEAMEIDATFANWPGDPCTQELPRPFRDYEVNQEMDTFELNVGSDNVIDIFFEGLCGHVWTEFEKVTVAACIGNAFGWTPVGGPSWERVQDRQEELLAQRIESGSRVREFE